jgi:hypothetical protein
VSIPEHALSQPDHYNRDPGIVTQLTSPSLNLST